MKTEKGLFNINLLMCLLFVGVVAGCQTPGEDDDEKPATIMRFHVETNPYGPEDHAVVTIGRNSPFQVAVQAQAFLSEIYIMEAALVETLGGYEIAIKFDREGSWILEQYTASHKSRHIAIYSQFGQERWLAAPVITRRISDGSFRFTPDATREETMRIVEGLQEVAAEVREENQF